MFKKKLVEREKEISDLEEKLKEKYVKKKRFSSVSVQTEDIHVECSSINSTYHPDEHHINSYTNKPHADKFHAEKSQVGHTPSVSPHTGTTLVQTNKPHAGKLQAEKVCTFKLPQASKIQAPSSTLNVRRSHAGKFPDVRPCLNNYFYRSNHQKKRMLSQTKPKKVWVPKKSIPEPTKMKIIWVPKRSSLQPETKQCREVRRKN